MFGGHRNVNRSLLAGIVEIAQTKELSKKFEVSLLNMREVLRIAARAHPASLQQFVAVLRTEMNRRRA